MDRGMLTAALRHDRAIVLGGLVAVILLAWAWLLLGAGLGQETMEMEGGAIMAMAPAWTPGYAALVLLMWVVMMAAMMLPGAAPTILLVAGIARRRAGAGGRVPATAALFALGYLAVWGAFSLVATATQWGLDQVMLPTTAGTVLAGIVFLGAGLYQWTPLKAACLRHCRSPLDFILHHWREGALGALATGMGHGLYCLGCCWMLMALLFAGGLMNPLWIAAIALLVLVEKTLPWGGRMAQLSGLALAAWGIGTLISIA
ncbi:MAG TPA: DUF2182 domain-containing protein [Stellaceae bacterium]|nr:DUF2182 domain-containing protein [Stellaceae bacterium]